MTTKPIRIDHSAHHGPYMFTDLEIQLLHESFQVHFEHLENYEESFEGEGRETPEYTEHVALVTALHALATRLGYTDSVIPPGESWTREQFDEYQAARHHLIVKGTSR